MPASFPDGQSAAHPWFHTPAGHAVVDGQSGPIAEALRQRPGQHWLWLGPGAAGGPDDGRGLRLDAAGRGWRGDIACALPLPLPNEAFATVVLQHAVPAGAEADALLAEVARILVPGGKLWMSVLNPLSPYRWRWRGTRLSAAEPLTWRRRLRAHGLVPDPVSQGVGPTWRIDAAAPPQHGPGLRAAYVLQAEKRELPLTPLRQPGALRLPQGAPAA
jgi:SAM-dependent methyltransferase